MIHADVATTLDKSHLKARLFEASMLNAYAYHALAPWTYIALMKLHNLEHGKNGQQGAAAARASVDAAMFARIALTGLRAENLPIPGVCSSESGDIAIIWTIGPRQIEAIFGADQSGSFVLSNGDVIVEDGEITAHDVAPLSRALEDMMAG